MSDGVDETTIEILVENGLDKRYHSCVQMWKDRKREIAHMKQQLRDTGEENIASIAALKDEYLQMIKHALLQRLAAKFPYVLKHLSVQLMA